MFRLALVCFKSLYISFIGNSKGLQRDIMGVLCLKMTLVIPIIMLEGAFFSNFCDSELPNDATSRSSTSNCIRILEVNALIDDG